jgi:succinoglycan biosynthesis protein ExoA
MPEPAGSPAVPVSLVMPVLDEELHLEEAVRQVLDQEYAGELELVLAVAPSKDRTAEIAAELAASDPRIRVVANPARRTPNALNLAIAAASHDYLVRVDAHGFLPAGYVTTVVRLLQRTGAANVGGVMRAEGDTVFGRAVARAMTSRLGIGSASFHVGGEEGPAPTVYLGAFRRDALEAVGGFDEHFWRAQDWELNHRLRAAGETIWFTPELEVRYAPRRTPRALARQFHGSGRWRREIVRLYPETKSPRYLLPPVVTALVAAGTVAGASGVAVRPLAPTAVTRGLLAGWVLPAGYGLGVLGAGAVIGRGLPLPVRLRLPGVLAIMHLSWGAGFLRSIPRERRRMRPRPQGR